MRWWAAKMGFTAERGDVLCWSELVTLKNNPPKLQFGSCSSAKSDVTRYKLQEKCFPVGTNWGFRWTTESAQKGRKLITPKFFVRSRVCEISHVHKIYAQNSMKFMTILGMDTTLGVEAQ